jgi:hypothetical protein
MSTDISLNVVYQRVQTNPTLSNVVYPQDVYPQEERIESISSSDSSSETSVSLYSQSESTNVVQSSEPEQKTEKKYRKVLFYIGIIFSVTAAIWIILLLSFSLKFYANINQCLHPKSMDSKTAVFNENNIEQINFQVVSGMVNILFHDNPHISVTLLSKYRDGSFIDKRTVSSSMKVTDGVLNIVHESPAFDFTTCQHAAIQILVPKKYSKSISLTGVIKAGILSIDGDSMSNIGNIDVVVEVGKILIERISAKNISLTSEIGLIKVYDTMTSGSLNVNAHVGFFKSIDLVVRQFISDIKFGGSCHTNIVSDKVVIDTKYGYSRVAGVSSLSLVNENFNVDISTHYGKSTLFLENDQVDFSIGNKRGVIDLEYEDNEYKCGVVSKTGTGMKGTCKDIELIKDSKSKAHINVNTDYGNSLIHVESLEQD